MARKKRKVLSSDEVCFHLVLLLLLHLSWSRFWIFVYLSPFFSFSLTNFTLLPAFLPLDFFISSLSPNTFSLTPRLLHQFFSNYHLHEQESDDIGDKRRKTRATKKKAKDVSDDEYFGSEDEDKSDDDLMKDILTSSDEEEDDDYRESDNDNDDDDDDEAELGDDAPVQYEDGYTEEELAKLPQIERENIMYERYLKDQEVADRRAALREERGKKGTSRGKRKPAKKSTDKRKAKFSALAEISARRKETKTRRMDALDFEEDDDLDDLDEEPVRKGASSSSSSRRRRRDYSDEDDDYREYRGDGDDAAMDEEEQTAQLRKGVEEPSLGVKQWATATPVSTNDLVDLQMRRHILEKIFNEPWFDKYVIGKFVRVGIGENRSGEGVYRACEIMEVSEHSSAYQFAGFETKKALHVRWGKAERNFRMNLVSTKRITPQEFDGWAERVRKDGMEMLTREEVIARKKVAEKFRNAFKYDNSKVEEMIVRRMEQGTWKGVNIALERSKMQVDLDRAREEGDTERVKKLEGRLDGLEEHQRKQRMMNAGGIKNTIAQINKKNMLRNIAMEDKVARMKYEASDKPVKKTPFRRKATRPLLGVGDEVVGSKKEEKKKEDQSKAMQIEEEEGSYHTFICIFECVVCFVAHISVVADTLFFFDHFLYPLHQRLQIYSRCR